MHSQNFDFTYEQEQGISVVTFCGHELALNDRERIDRIWARICEIVDSGVERLILDFRNVAYCSTDFLYILILLRKKLATHKEFQPPSSRDGLFLQVCPDRQTAIDAIAEPESDPLILCSLKPHVREAFCVL